MNAVRRLLELVLAYWPLTWKSTANRQAAATAAVARELALSFEWHCPHCGESRSALNPSSREDHVARNGRAHGAVSGTRPSIGVPYHE